MNKKYCEICKKEIDKECVYVSYRKKTLINYQYYIKDFCSIKCLNKFLEGIVIK